MPIAVRDCGGHPVHDRAVPPRYRNPLFSPAHIGNPAAVYPVPLNGATAEFLGIVIGVRSRPPLANGMSVRTGNWVVNAQAERRVPMAWMRNGSERATAVASVYHEAPPYGELAQTWERLATEYNEAQNIGEPMHVYRSIETRTIGLPFNVRRLTHTMNYDAFIGDPIRAIAEATDLDEMRERGAERAREGFVTTMQGRNARNQENAEQNAEHARQSYSEVATMLGQRAQQVEQAERELRLVLLDAEQNPSDPASEWDALLRHPKVASVTMERDHFINVVTTELWMTHPNTGVSAPLGEMTITIPLDMVNHGGNVTITNRTNSQAGRPHPHVGGDTVPCWGDGGPTIMRAVGAGEIVGAVELILQYLESFNPRDSWGENARHWFNAAEGAGTLVQPGEAESEADQDEDGLTAVQRAARELGIAATGDEQIPEGAGDTPDDQPPHPAAPGRIQFVTFNPTPALDIPLPEAPPDDDEEEFEEEEQDENVPF